MALQTSGAISLNDIHVEAGGSSASQAGLNDADIRGLISKSSGSQMAFNEWYGASSFTLSVVESAVTIANSTNSYNAKNVTFANNLVQGDLIVWVGWSWRETNTNFFYDPNGNYGVSVAANEHIWFGSNRSMAFIRAKFVTAAMAGTNTQQLWPFDLGFGGICASVYNTSAGSFSTINVSSATNGGGGSFGSYSDTLAGTSASGSSSQIHVTAAVGYVYGFSTDLGTGSHIDTDSPPSHFPSWWNPPYSHYAQYGDFSKRIFSAKTNSTASGSRTSRNSYTGLTASYASAIISPS